MEPEAASRDPRGPRASRRRLRARLALAAAAVGAVGLLVQVSPGGPRLVSIASPRPGEVVGVEGLWVMVRIPDDERVAAETLRVWLNGADVTAQLATGQNGAVGRLHGLLDGENVLRAEVQASSWWADDRRYASGDEVRFLARRPLHLDRG